jgi:hypothetical protein
MLKWIVHEAVVKERLPEFLGVVARRGDAATVLSGRAPDLPDADGSLAVGLVTVQVARRIHREGKLLPGVFWSPTAFSQTSWMPFWGRLALNGDMVWLPWGEFVRRGPDVWRTAADGGHIFLRPDSGQKTFTGQMLGLDGFAANVAALDATSGVRPETLIGVCRPKPIDGAAEWRFWLRRGAVIACSPYSWDGDIRLAGAPPPPGVHALADEIARSCADEQAWIPDSAFAADLCLSGGQPRLIELNSASCAGLYSVDIDALLNGLAQVAEAEAADGLPQ